MSKSNKRIPLTPHPVAVIGITAIGLASTLHATAPNPSTGSPPPGQAKKERLLRLEDATIPEIQEAMEGGALTSVELVSLYLRRIQAYDKASIISPNQPLNSIGALNPDLLEDAAEADLLRKEGAPLGPLHGIPFLVKWSYSIANMPITGGVTGWKDLVTLNETWSGTKMRAAGGIAMGHANMDNWANSASTSTSQIKGTVRSSYLQGAAPGGSSGGSGVSSGAYLATFAFGGETGGSIRNPGDRNGLVAYKVSGGSISVNRIIPLAPERDVIGPLTRSTVDNAIIRDVVGGLDPDDIWAPAIPILTDKRPVPETGFSEAMKTATLAGKKIGIIGTYVGLPHPDPLAPGSTTNTTAAQTTTPATFALVEQAKLDMEAAGATVNYVFMPPTVSTTYNRGVEAPVTRLLTAPFSTNVAAYSYRGLIEGIVATPADTPNSLAAKVLATAALPRNGNTFYISAAVRAAMYNVDLVTGDYSPGAAFSFGSPEGQEHYTARRDQKNAFEAWMDAEGLDAVVWPVWPNKTRTGGTIIGRDLVNFMYLPAVTVPMGVLTQVATATLAEGTEPLTLNVTGRLYDDAKVLAIASAYEAITKHRYSPTLAPPIAGEEFMSGRFRTGTAKKDALPPVLSISPVAAAGETDSIIFTGMVSDKGGIERLEVSIAGALIPTVIEGTTWKAVLPGESAANALLASATTVDVVVLAVDTGGNATCLYEDITL
ncbi:MAG: amidase family protein [Verrucomicrobiota bacterium]